MDEEHDKYWDDVHGQWISRETWEAAKIDEKDAEEFFSLGEAEEPADVWVFDSDGHRRALIPADQMEAQGYVWIHNTWFETDDSTFTGFTFVNAPRGPR